MEGAMKGPAVIFLHVSSGTNPYHAISHEV
jgi:hypothetical protein